MRVMIGFLVQGRVRIKIRFRVRVRVRVGVTLNVSVYHRSNCRRSKCRKFSFHPSVSIVFLFFSQILIILNCCLSWAGLGPTVKELGVDRDEEEIYPKTCFTMLLPQVHEKLQVTQCTRPKFNFLFWGATFHIPLTKSVTLNRLLHTVSGNFQGLFFDFQGLFFAFQGQNCLEPPCNSCLQCTSNGIQKRKEKRKGT